MMRPMLAGEVSVVATRKSEKETGGAVGREYQIRAAGSAVAIDGTWVRESSFSEATQARRC